MYGTPPMFEKATRDGKKDITFKMESTKGMSLPPPNKTRTVTQQTRNNDAPAAHQTRITRTLTEGLRDGVFCNAAINSCLSIR
jgi:hypothetical protein